MKIKDLTGKRFGSLTVVRFYPRETGNSNKHWECLCDCGNFLVVRGDNLATGHSTKCSMCARNRGHGSVFVEEGEQDGVV